MATIHVCELSEITSVLPDIVPFTISEGDTRCDDLFVCAIGFEPRCLAFPMVLSESGYRAARVICLEYETNPDDNAVNRPRLRKYLDLLSSDITSINADSAEFFRSLRACISSIPISDGQQAPLVTFDISAVGNRFVLKTMKVLLEANLNLRIVYAEADKYYPTQAECERQIDKAQLERGVSRVEISPEHPGRFLDPLPDCVVIFPSFNAERSQAVLDFVDPSLLTNPEDKIAWLVGRPHEAVDRWRIGATMANNGISPSTPHQLVSTFEYREALLALESACLQRREKYNITLVPLGSKLQAISASLFCYMHPEVRVVFASPKKYNSEQYSDGVKATWAVNLGLTASLRSTLDRVGTLTISD